MLPTYNPKTQVPCEIAWLEGLLKHNEKVDKEFKERDLPAPPVSVTCLQGYIDSAKTILKYKI